MSSQKSRLVSCGFFYFGKMPAVYCILTGAGGRTAVS